MRGPRNVPRRNGQPRTGLDGDRRAIFQPAGTDLRALQVLHDADVAVFLLRDLAQPIDEMPLLLLSSMRKVESRHVHSGTHQVTQHRLTAAGRSESTNNSRFAR